MYQEARLRSPRAIAISTSFAFIFVIGSAVASAQSIEGRVTTAQGAAVAAAQVKLARGGSSAAVDAAAGAGAKPTVTTTDTAGNFRFLGLEAGDYVVSVERDGYYSAS